ncbi:MAG: hypothetical protein ACRC8A_01330 [Microcoleaceae cyanobacterium]
MTSIPAKPSPLHRYPDWKLEDAKARFSEVVLLRGGWEGFDELYIQHKTVSLQEKANHQG